MARVPVCPVDDLAPGAQRLITVEGRSIGLFNVGGALYAVRNVCPHQGAELCRGTTSGTMLPSSPKEYVYGLEGRVLRCPWHGWEFDLATGEKLFDAGSNARVKTYDVTVEDGVVMLEA